MRLRDAFATRRTTRTFSGPRVCAVKQRNREPGNQMRRTVERTVNANPIAPGGERGPPTVVMALLGATGRRSSMATDCCGVGAETGSRLNAGDWSSPGL